MDPKVNSSFISSRELMFQLLLHVFVFTFYAIERRHSNLVFHFETYQLVFFLNYMWANFLISYLLLPKVFYRKKYWLFVGLVLLTITAIVLIEELVLEKIFFPGFRGESFPGVLFSLAEVLPVLAILSGFKFGWDALTKQRQLEELKVMIQESELEFLRSQINPHFLFNNLNNLYSYAIENSPKTPTIILELSSVLRYMLYECREKFVPLSKEIEQLKNFTQLYELQIEERGVVTFNTRNIHSGYQIAPLILMVFIENAFKHSQASQATDIFIDIDLQVTNEGILEFRCKNSFELISPSTHSSKGIGLENVQKRLQLLYPGAHELQIQQTEKHYEVTLTLQLQKDHSL